MIFKHTHKNWFVSVRITRGIGKMCVNLCEPQLKWILEEVQFLTDIGTNITSTDYNMKREYTNYLRVREMLVKEKVYLKKLHFVGHTSMWIPFSKYNTDVLKLNYIPSNFFEGKKIQFILEDCTNYWTHFW